MGRTPKPAASGNSYNFEGFGAGNPNFSQSFYPGFDNQYTKPFVVALEQLMEFVER